MPNEPVTMEQVDAVAAAKPAIVGMADEFAALLADAVPASEYTDSVPLVDKERLIGMPFIVTACAYNEGIGKDATYVFVKCMLANGAFVGFNDGGVGIEPVLQSHMQDGENAKQMVDENGAPERMIEFVRPLVAPRGLRKSEYTNDEGIDGITYYFG